MASHKKTDSAADLNKPYEENEIQLKGIINFGIGLVLLIVVTFALMWAFLNQLNVFSRPDPSQKNPMAMSDKEKLPPEPRLQLAPGFGVDSEHGRVNMELGPPQAEYRELHKQWMHLWEHGQKDEKTGVVSVMPIEEAMQKVMSANLKAKSGAEAEESFDDSKMIVSDASSGRMATLKRR